VSNLAAMSLQAAISIQAAMPASAGVWVGIGKVTTQNSKTEDKEGGCDPKASIKDKNLQVSICSEMRFSSLYKELCHILWKFRNAWLSDL
jgi:hypothetical protein